MAWSTRQLADLAGTTVKAVRHYHKVGLLDEPTRSANGYKRYGVAHLVRLLRIRRLTDLGVPLAQIAAMGDVDEHPEEALRLLDAELAGTIDRLQRVRAELGLILRRSLPTDLPPELAEVADDLSEADRALMVVYSRILSPAKLEAFRRMLPEYAGHPTDAEFDALPADADEDTRRELADRLCTYVLDLYAAHPDVRIARWPAPGADLHVTRTIDLALADLFNEAQLDVLDRVRQLVRDRRLE